MNPKISKLLIALFAICIFTILFNSCKKDSKSSGEAVNKERLLAIEAVKKQYGNTGRAYVYPVNKNAETMYYRNSTGQMVKQEKKLIGTDAADCTHNCNNTTDPNDIVATYTLQYIQRNYDCGSSTLSSLYAKWLISVPYTPLLVDPTNSANHSYGVIDMYPFSGSPASSGNITDITIRSLGADPNCDSNNRYEITYRWQLDDNLIFGDFAQASLTLYNNCGLLGNLHSTGMITGNTMPNAPYEDTDLNPCERVDKVWVNPGLGSSDASALGSYNICSSFPSGFIATTYQQVQWRKVNNANSYHWDDQTLMGSNPSPIYTLAGDLFSAWTGFATLTGMHSGSGTWLVRYRNRESSYGCGSAGAFNSSNGGTWTAPYVTEIWSL